MPSNTAYNSVRVVSTYGNGIHSKTERVHIRNGKGYKQVAVRNGTKTRKSRKPLNKTEVKHILNQRLVPNLFKPCHDACQKRG
jgi:hypothetical protein